ncbi:uncharacterized protein LOC129590476 [Paramacrobiotus metropolitanus]|uniref:uncharacterized protein LOC129590476 n=1 Tax=Paramacrobiotus metropolitanus TaxID=2943436 RepID=UPI00244654B3|nr:uncharacterized protein LOC129590476 [Paramacrobiotus metropolitanus]
MNCNDSCVDAEEWDTAGYWYFFDPFHLAFTGLLIVALQTVMCLAVVGCRLRRFKEVAGGITFCAVAGTTFAFSQHYYLRQILLTSFVCLWAIRLAAYLCYRQTVLEEEQRDMLVQLQATTVIGKEDDQPPSFSAQRKWARLLVFWTFQAFWAFIVSIPLVLSNSPVMDHLHVAGMPADQPLYVTDLDIMGIVMWAVGFLIEFCADCQKFRFRRKPSNEDKFCDDGLWTWSRHPNYFGELLQWWGIFVMYSQLISERRRWMWLGLCSPLAVSGAILFLSGMPPQEQSAHLRYGHDEDYQDYKYSTSPLVPMPPELYVKFPRFVQMCCLFELPLYDFLAKKPKTDSQPAKPARRLEMPY